MTGTVINTLAILVGGTLGALVGNRLPPGIRTIVIQGVGLVTLVVGVEMALGTENVLLLLGSVLIGGILGQWWQIEERLERFGGWLESRASRYPLLTRGDFVRGFVTASLVFCVGPMAVVGSMQEGITGDATLLVLKSVLDLFTSVAFAASLGMGVTFAAGAVLLLQGGLTLSAGVLQGLLSEAMVVEMTAVGGVMLLGIGLLILDIKRVKVANLMPGLAIAPMLVPLWAIVERWLAG
jgi:uncharacterized protein